MVNLEKQRRQAKADTKQEGHKKVPGAPQRLKSIVFDSPFCLHSNAASIAPLDG